MPTDAPEPAEVERWHRHFAAECNNLSWNLAARPSRTPAEADEMLRAAYAAAFHWSKVGQPINGARADVTLAHAHALAGNGALALRHAEAALAFYETGPCEDWDLAFGHAEVAHAASILGRWELHADHYETAGRLGQAIGDPEDRAAFLEEFARIPAPASI